MKRPTARELRGPWRRGLFWLWIAGLIAVAIYLGVAAPLASYFGEGYVLVSIIIPPVMLLLLGAGLAWLVALATTRPRRRQDRAG